MLALTKLCKFHYGFPAIVHLVSIIFSRCIETYFFYESANYTTKIRI
jgi:hypothetical protein